MILSHFRVFRGFTGRHMKGAERKLKEKEVCSFSPMTVLLRQHKMGSQAEGKDASSEEDLALARDLGSSLSRPD